MDVAERIARGWPAAERRRRERVKGAEVVEVDGLMLAFANVAEPSINTAFVEREPSNVDAAIGGAEARFQERGRSFGIDVQVGRHPAVDEGVRSAGLQLLFEQPGMAAAIADLPTVPDPAGVDIRPVVDASGAAAFATVDMQAFENPPEVAEGFYAAGVGGPDTAAYVAWEREEPVGACAAYLHEGAVGVLGVGVVPRARRRGIASALTARAARAFPGADLAWLHATEHARTLYEGLGFRAVSTWEVWIRPG